jgi:hypothetical protein
MTVAANAFSASFAAGIFVNIGRPSCRNRLIRLTFASSSASEVIALCDNY